MEGMRSESGGMRALVPGGSAAVVAAAALVLVVTLFVVSAAGAQDVSGSDIVDIAGVEGFIRFEGIDGESMDVDHHHWCDLRSLDQAMLASAAGAAPGRGAVQATFEDILVAKDVDKAGPKLQEAVAKGTILPKVEIDLTRPFGGFSDVFYRFELTNVRVTGYNIGTTGQSELTPSGLPRIELGGPTVFDSWPVEEVSLAFEGIKVIYTEYDGEGQKKGNVEFEWSVEAGAR